MKIVIGTNTFGSYHRQDVAVDSWKHLASKFDCVDVIDVQLVGQSSHDYGIPAVTALKRHSGDLVPGSDKKLPVVSDILKVLGEHECDYFIYVNSDVIINSNLIKYIIKELIRNII